MTADRQVWLKAWLLCGALDSLYATGVALVRGTGAAAVWLGVASGPFGDGARDWGAAGVLSGLAVHFALMAVMVAVGLWLARRTMLGEVAVWKAGTLYGMAIYAVMYGFVLSQNFGVPFPNPDRVKVAIGLFPHIFLVGLPMFHMFKQMPQPS